MNIQVTPHTISITINTNINAGEYNITPCEFTFTEEYEDLTKEAIFSSCDGSVFKVSILNNQCTIPYEVLQQEGNVLLGVYAYETNDDELVLRYSPTPQYFNVKKGSFQVGNDPDLPSPTEWERVLEQINQAIEETNNLNITANKEGKVATITITKKDGTTQSVEIDDGADGNDAKINGVNTLTIQEGENISISQSGSTMTISATGGSGGTSDYTDLTNKPSINNVILSGNKTTADLGIVIPDLTDYVKNTDYAISSVGGVVKANSSYGASVNENGIVYALSRTYAQYSSDSVNYIISKGTLENVLNEKIGNINTILATLTTPSNQGGNS